MKDKNGDITIKSIWKYLRSDKGKRFSFFIFYIFFFIFLFILLSFKDTENKTLIEEVSLPYTLNNFEEDKVQYTCLINYNNNLSEYVLKRDNNNLTLTDDRGTFYYSYQDGNLISLDEEEPFAYSIFLNIYELKRIIKAAILDSETKMNVTGEYIYNYKIKNSTLKDLLNTSLEIKEDLENEIIIQTDLNKETKIITLNILNYIKSISLNEEIDTFQITFTYGEIYE